MTCALYDHICSCPYSLSLSLSLSLFLFLSLFSLSVAAIASANQTWHRTQIFGNLHHMPRCGTESLAMTKKYQEYQQDIFCIVFETYRFFHNIPAREGKGETNRENCNKYSQFFTCLPFCVILRGARASRPSTTSLLEYFEPQQHAIEKFPSISVLELA